MTGRFAAIVLIAMSCPTLAWGQTSAEYARMGKETWAVLNCAALADFADEPGEATRLFVEGLKKGRAFEEAAGAGKIQQEDFNREVPIALLMATAVPTMDVANEISNDFVLGAAWATALANARDRAYDPHSNPSRDGKLAQSIAKNAFSEKNCSLM